MSLLKDRESARRSLETAVKNLMQANDFGGVIKSPKYVRLCKKRARVARANLDNIDRKLYKIGNHAISPRLEMIAKLMVIFSPDNPEVKKEIESIVTFT